MKLLKQFNQRKHYKQYSESINSYFIEDEGIRDRLSEMSPRSYTSNVEKIGGGFCGEHANVLAFKLRCQLKDKLEYKMRKMLADVDHAYLYIHAKVDSERHVYFCLDNWNKDFRELSKDEYYSIRDSRWGKHKVKDKWSNHDRLTTNSDEVRIITREIQKNDHEDREELPNYVYNNEPHHDDVIIKLNNRLSDTKKRKKMPDTSCERYQSRRRGNDPLPIFSQHSQTQESVAHRELHQ
ncbi:hypothetical protein L3V82_05120 [Thiotrichales bacterium 19S3-7]|nr:hypothetical protein [Thiotrichales bacterium 19S3-7]MCF6801473.1 hypothetical protein [Thiotrichales bacterium 19S3-11]